MEGHHERKTDELVIRDFVILGLSPHSCNQTVKSGLLRKIIKRHCSTFLDYLKCVRWTCRCVNQNALLLCMGIYYVDCVNSKEQEKKFSHFVNVVCRIPSDLFKLINVVGNKEKIEEDFVNCHQVKDINNLMTKNPFKHKGCRPDNSPQSDPRLNLEALSIDKSPNPYYKFIQKHEFIEKWYLDDREDGKNAIDFLYLMTKFKCRYGWDHKMIINHSHFNFPGRGLHINDEAGKENQENGDIGNISMIINYVLHGFKNFNKFDIYREYFENCDKPEYNGKLPIDEITNTAIGAIHVIERSKTSSVDLIVKFIERYWRRRKHPETYGGREEPVLDIPYKVDGESDDEEDDGEAKITMVMGDGGSSDISYYAIDHRPPFIDESADSKYDRFHFCHEHLPTVHYRNPEIWQALIQDMPIIALIRHISHIASLGLLSDDTGDANVKMLLEKIRDPKRITQVHPFQILKAILQYKEGGRQPKRKRKAKKEDKWDVRDDLYEGLCESFYTCLKSNPRTTRDELDLTSDLKYKVCVQASGSMLDLGFTGDLNLCRAHTSIAMAHGIQHFCKNTDIRICRKEAYGVDEKSKKKGKIRTNYSVGADETDLCSRVRRFKGAYLAERHTSDDLPQPAATLAIPPSPSTKPSNLDAPISRSIESKEHIDAFILFTTCIRSELMGGHLPYEVFKRYQKEVDEKAKLILCVMDVLDKDDAMMYLKDPSVKLLCGADGYLLREIIQFMHPERCNNEDACGFCGFGDCSTAQQGEQGELEQP